MINNLKQIRKIKKITQKELAEFLNVSKAMISMWENNPNEKIPEERIRQIAQFLKVDEKEIFIDQINIEELKKGALKEEMQDLMSMYSEQYDADLEFKVGLIEVRNNELSEELNKITNMPKKLEQLKRFSQILNNEELELTLNRIKPSGMDRILNDILSPLENGDLQKIKVVALLFEYISFLNQSNKLDNPPFNYPEEILEIDKLIMKLISKKGNV